MGNKNWWAMMVVTVMVVLACTSPAASTRPTGAATTAPSSEAPSSEAPSSEAPSSEAPSSEAPSSEAPSSEAPSSEAPSSEAPSSEAPSSEAPSSEAPGEPAVPTVPTGYTELDAALGADKPYTGKRVTIQTQWIGGEGANFDAVVADFEAATGIDIVQESIASQHEVVLRTRILGQTPPDLAMLAQPSAVVAYGTAGQVVDVATFMDADKLNEEYAATGFGTQYVSGPNGEIFGVPYKVDVKSTIWYPIKAFEAAGYEVPTNWEELEALEAEIVASGKSPWCVGILDGAATGWIATDWLEDIMLRTAGIDAYNRWITHELPFDSPEVRAALDVLAERWFTEGYVYGGSEAITATDRLQPMDPMFPPDGNWDGFTPECWMHRQATWFFPDFAPDKRANTDPSYVSQYVLGEDIGLMYFPSIDPAQGTPVLGSGDTLMVPTPAPVNGAATPVRPEVMAVAEFLATPYGLQRWIERGSAFSANQTTDPEWYAGAYKLDFAAEILGNSTGFGFDASDLQPPAVGQGTFWSGMVEWIDAGGTNTDTVLQNIDASWPSQ